jgi:hypothetical protein
MPQLRQYQEAIVEELHRLIAGGVRSVLVTAPTGSGTVVAAAMIVAKPPRPGSASSRGKRRRGPDHDPQPDKLDRACGSRAALRVDRSCVPPPVWVRAVGGATGRFISAPES